MIQASPGGDLMVLLGIDAPKATQFHLGGRSGGGVSALKPPCV